MNAAPDQRVQMARFSGSKRDTNQGTRGEDTRWRERPRPGALGSGAGQDTGVVHAIVSVVTAGPSWFEEAAASAA